MQYNVAQFLKESVGAVRIYSVDEETTTSSGATERVMGELRLLRTDKGIWASATLTCEKPSTCSRCLSPFVLSLNLSIKEEYVPTIDVHTGERLNKTGVDEDAFIIDEQNILDIQEAVRQYGEVVPLEISPRSKGYTGMWKRVPLGPCSFISPFNLEAIDIPKAAEIEVDECPVPNASYSFSPNFGKPDIPPNSLFV